jgi:hypothetical protein
MGMEAAKKAAQAIPHILAFAFRAFRKPIMAAPVLQAFLFAGRILLETRRRKRRENRE